MKKIIIALAAAAMFVACGGPKTPVDELCNLLDEGAATLLSGKKDVDKAFEDKFEALFEANETYTLTDADKDKVLDKLGDLMDIAMDNAIKEGQIPEEYLDMAKEQMRKEMSSMTDKIKAAETLGDIKKMFD